MSEPLKIYRESPPTQDQLRVMLSRLDGAIGVFEELGIPGHEAAHALGAFRADLSAMVTEEPAGGPAVADFPAVRVAHRAAVASLSYYDSMMGRKKE